MFIILDVQGFKKPNNAFVVKELALVKLNDKNEVQETNCTLYKPPCKWSELPAKYRCINMWLIRNYHGIPWEAGQLPYEAVENVIKLYTRHIDYIYVKGSEKKEWLQTIISYPKTIINLDDLDCPSLRNFKLSHPCWYNHHHSTVANYHCALENVLQLKLWYVQRNLTLRQALHEHFECDNILTMDAEEISRIPIGFLRMFPPEDIAAIWNRLPEEVKMDEDIANRHLERSLHYYLKNNDIRSLDAEGIACLPKSFIRMLPPEDIATIWEKLPEDIKLDTDIAKCRRCRIHHQSQNDRELQPFVKDCYECQALQV